MVYFQSSEKHWFWKVCYFSYCFNGFLLILTAILLALLNFMSYFYYFSSWHSFRFIPQILICCILFYSVTCIFFPLRLPLWPIDSLKFCCLISNYLETFLLTLFLTPPLIPLFSRNLLCIISSLLNMLRFVLWPRICMIFVNALWALESNVYFYVLG